MTIIAMDIQPQRCFTCVADSENFVPYARQAVYELNKQAMYAHRRVLVQNLTILGCAGFCTGGIPLALYALWALPRERKLLD